MSRLEHVNAVFDLIDDDSEDAQLKPCGPGHASE